jgi:hypothetical protein
MPVRVWVRIALAAVLGVGALMTFAGGQAVILTGEGLGVLLFLACVGYALRCVARHFDERESR